MRGSVSSTFFRPFSLPARLHALQHSLVPEPLLSVLVECHLVDFVVIAEALCVMSLRLLLSPPQPYLSSLSPSFCLSLSSLWFLPAV